MTPSKDLELLLERPGDMDPVARARVYNARQAAAKRLAAWVARFSRIEVPLARWEWRR